MNYQIRMTPRLSKQEVREMEQNHYPTGFPSLRFQGVKCGRPVPSSNPSVNVNNSSWGHWTEMDIKSKDLCNGGSFLVCGKHPGYVTIWQTIKKKMSQSLFFSLAWCLFETEHICSARGVKSMGVLLSFVYYSRYHKAAGRGSMVSENHGISSENSYVFRTFGKPAQLQTAKRKHKDMPVCRIQQNRLTDRVITLDFCKSQDWWLHEVDLSGLSVTAGGRDCFCAGEQFPQKLFRWLCLEDLYLTSSFYENYYYYGGKSNGQRREGAATAQSINPVRDFQCNDAVYQLLLYSNILKTHRYCWKLSRNENIFLTEHKTAKLSFGMQIK